MSKWDKEAKLCVAADRTKKAQNDLSALENILRESLRVDVSLDWESLKKLSNYRVTKPSRPKQEPEPLEPDKKYNIKLEFLDKIIRSRKESKKATAKNQYMKDHKKWMGDSQKASEKYKSSLALWKSKKDKFLHNIEKHNSKIDEKKEAYLQGTVDSVLDYYNLILSKSKYPDYFPKSFELDYNPDNKLLLIDYQLPALSIIPTTCEIKYIQSRSVFVEKHLSKTQINKLYNNVLYQIALRNIYEIIKTDIIKAIDIVVFNGYVCDIDPATGHEKTACILSLQANRKEFESINLENVEPKACFKSLKGVGSSKLYSLTPIAPILKIDRKDKRFTSSYGVADDLGEECNLAAMDWEDFEHLVRELFEKEFAAYGGEVKVTRASRDGGIDAIAFDPDPIRGGKIAIQAKRYTNTVGVSSVRDLYGTVINEGAAKGVLVTTSDYGPDAYEFSKGKPLTLINGNQLLFLLEKHGHKAKIDLKEAKRILSEQN